MKVHFMGICITSLLHQKEKNPTLAVQTNYETYNNREVASIYTKIINNCVELSKIALIQLLLQPNLDHSLLTKNGGAKLTAYHYLHRIRFVDSVDMLDYISKFQSAHHRLANIGLVISNKVFIYILIMGLGSEFASQITIVRNSFQTISEPPSFDTLTVQLLDENTYCVTTKVVSVTLLTCNQITQKTTKVFSSAKMKCRHYGYNHAGDDCYHQYFKKIPLSQK